MGQGHPIDCHDRRPRPSETPLPEYAVQVLRFSGFMGSGTATHAELWQLSGRAIDGGEGAQIDTVLETRSAALVQQVAVTAWCIRPNR